MELNPQQRTQAGSARHTSSDLEDSAVLRISRIALKAEPPVVRFIERGATLDGQQRTR